MGNTSANCSSNLPLISPPCSLVSLVPCLLSQIISGILKWASVPLLLKVTPRCSPTVPFQIKLKVHLFSVGMCRCHVHSMAYMWKSEYNSEELSPSTLWNRRMKLGLPGLVANTFPKEPFNRTSPLFSSSLMQRAYALCLTLDICWRCSQRDQPILEDDYYLAVCCQSSFLCFCLSGMKHQGSCVCVSADCYTLPNHATVLIYYYIKISVLKGWARGQSFLPIVHTSSGFYPQNKKSLQRRLVTVLL